MAVYEGYKYDVFISFPGEQPQANWMDRLFEPVFRGLLSNAFPTWTPRIFFMNTEAQIGSDLEAEIADALRNSCVLLPVLSYPYFRRPWCAAEWRTFRSPALDPNGKLGRPRNIAPAIYAGDPAFYPSHGQSAGGLIYQSLSDFSAMKTPNQKFIKKVGVIATAVASILQKEKQAADPLWPAFGKAHMVSLSNTNLADALQWMLLAPPTVAKPNLGQAA